MSKSSVAKLPYDSKGTVKVDGKYYESFLKYWGSRENRGWFRNAMSTDKRKITKKMIDIMRKRLVEWWIKNGHANGFKIKDLNTITSIRDWGFSIGFGIEIVKVTNKSNPKVYNFISYLIREMNICEKTIENKEDHIYRIEKDNSRYKLYYSTCISLILLNAVLILKDLFL